MKRTLVTFGALLLASCAPDALAAADAATPGSSPYGASFFPNVTLMTQDGKKVRFYDDLLKDKQVLIDFIYASCQAVCPLQSAKLAQMQKALGPRMGRNFFIYSITLDPEHDTPEVLKEYASRFGAKPGWLFLTGARADIDAVRFKLGERGEMTSHGNTVRVGDVAKGRWMRLPLTADINYLVTEVGKTLDPNWYAGQTVKNFDDAPRFEIPEQSKAQLMGQDLYRNRCAVCHTIGAGDRIGPDLKGVTARRERAWLTRYLAAPDQMLAAKDPIAVELAKRSKVPMPNLNLTREQIDNLLAYLDLQVSGAEPKKSEAAAVKDPVCGMDIDPAKAIRVEEQGRTLYFCSRICRDKYGASKRAATKNTASASAN